MPRLERDVFRAYAERPELTRQQVEPEVDFREVLIALSRVLHRAEMYHRHAVKLEPLSVRERMSDVLARVNDAPRYSSPSSVCSTSVKVASASSSRSSR